MFYKSLKLERFSWLEHGFGTRHTSLNFPLKTKQLHGSNVHILTGKEDGVLEGDAFITNFRDVTCFIRTADCVPILLSDPKKRAVGAVHAGWRGVAAGVIKAAVAQMINLFGTNANDVIAAIGPSICKNCYEVGPDVIEKMTEAGLPSSLWSGSDGVFHFDLKGACRKQLANEGVLENNVETLPHCTFCCDDLISYRREKDKGTRQISYIVMR